VVGNIDRKTLEKALEMSRISADIDILVDIVKALNLESYAETTKKMKTELDQSVKVIHCMIRSIIAFNKAIPAEIKETQPTKSDYILQNFGLKLCQFIRSEWGNKDMIVTFIAFIEASERKIGKYALAFFKYNSSLSKKFITLCILYTKLALTKSPTNSDLLQRKAAIEEICGINALENININNLTPAQESAISRNMQRLTIEQENTLIKTMLALSPNVEKFAKECYLLEEKNLSILEIMKESIKENDIYSLLIKIEEGLRSLLANQNDLAPGYTPEIFWARMNAVLTRKPVDSLQTAWEKIQAELRNGTRVYQGICIGKPFKEDIGHWLYITL